MLKLVHDTLRHCIETFGTMKLSASAHRTMCYGCCGGASSIQQKSLEEPLIDRRDSKCIEMIEQRANSFATNSFAAKRVTGFTYYAGEGAACTPRRHRAARQRLRRGSRAERPRQGAPAQFIRRRVRRVPPGQADRCRSRQVHRDVEGGARRFLEALPPTAEPS